MKNKKGQGISISYVVVGIIAVVVLIVVILIFTGGIQPLNQKAQDLTSATCTGTYKGEWKEKCSDEEKQILAALSDFKDHPGQVCCVKKK